MSRSRSCLGRPPLVGLLAALLTAIAAPPRLEANTAGTSFTYQGQLRKSSTPFTGTCTIQLTFWNAENGGTQLGLYQQSGIAVTSGLFTMAADFGNGFSGDERWIQVAVQCGTDVSLTPLLPRQRVTAAPYAVGLVPGAVIRPDDTNAVQSVLYNEPSLTAVTSTTVTGLTNAVAIEGQAIAGPPVFFTFPPLRTGLFGVADGGYGVYGSSNSAAGVFGISTDVNGSGVEGQGSGGNAAGIFGHNDSGHGVWGRSTGVGAGTYGEALYAGGKGVSGAAPYASSIAVYGQADQASSIAVEGSSMNGQAIFGTSGASFGVHGYSAAAGSAGILGESPNIGVQGNSTGSGSTRQAIRGENYGSATGYAGYFNGNVAVAGNLTKPAGQFKIDHPLDPANKYLSHSFVESPDMKNIYDGIVTTDERGEAVVDLPEWFEALNRDFRYQLTVLGSFARAIVASEIGDGESYNRFLIRTDAPGVKVSWQVTGTRHDRYAEDHRIKVEEEKPENERGRYLYPEGFGQPLSAGVAYLPGSPTEGSASR